jgi:hypothetical protein
VLGFSTKPVSGSNEQSGLLPGFDRGGATVRSSIPCHQLLPPRIMTLVSSSPGSLGFPRESGEEGRVEDIVNIIEGDPNQFVRRQVSSMTEGCSVITLQWNDTEMVSV